MADDDTTIWLKRATKDRFHAWAVAHCSFGESMDAALNALLDKAGK